MRIHDISKAIEDGMEVYPGDPEVSVRRVARLENGDEANVSAVSFGTHTGTHIDPPLHLLSGGAGADSVSLEALIGPALVVDTGGAEIDREFLGAAGIGAAVRVLFKTGGRGGLTNDASLHLVGKGVRLVGIDGPTIECSGHEGLEAHRALLEAGVVILEGLELSGVEPGTYELICLPLKIKDGDGAPARAVLLEMS